MLQFPTPPLSVGQRFQNWTWDGVKWAPTPIGDFATQAWVMDQINALRQGVIDGSVAGPGEIGEALQVIGPSYVLNSYAVGTMCTLNLSPGDWDVSGAVYVLGGAAQLSLITAGISNMMNTVEIPDCHSVVKLHVMFLIAEQLLAVPTARINTITPLTIYGNAMIAGASASTSMGLNARRTR